MLVPVMLMLAACGSSGSGGQDGSGARDKACSVVPRLPDADTDPASFAKYASDTYRDLGAFSPDDRSVVQALGQVAEAAGNARSIQADRPGESWSSTLAGGHVKERLDAASAELRRLCGDSR
jgi:hypothetical protein